MANFTKIAIQKAFIKLLNNMPLNQISVRNIVEECGINRNSFYYHFHDIPSLLTEIIETTTDLVLNNHKSIDSIEEVVLEFIQFATKYRHAFMNVYNSMSRELFEQDLLKTCDQFVRKYFDKRTKNLAISDENKEIIILMYRSEFFGLICEWLMRGMDDEFVETFKKILSTNLLTETNILSSFKR